MIENNPVFRSSLLAITIPTYNRGELLGILLDSIARDFSIWPEDLEVLVLDNASTDNTQEQVQRRIDAGLPVHVICSQTNIGMDGNLAACFYATEAKYLWQIGDDEVLHAGSCRYILDFVRKHDFGLLHIESEGFTKGRQPEQFARAIPPSIDVYELNSSEMLRRANIYLTFISSNIINRQAILAAMPNFDSHAEINTYLPQLAWIYGVLKIKSRHFYVKTPMFGALGGNTSGYRLIEVFGLNLLAITERQLGTFIPNARRIMANAVLTRLLPGELISLSYVAERSGNQFEAEDLVPMLDLVFGKSFFLRWFTKPLISPYAAYRHFVFFFVRVFNKFNKAMKYIFL
jgi:glycosyltransferase involved in cell wall biosynthesis